MWIGWFGGARCQGFGNTYSNKWRKTWWRTHSKNFGTGRHVSPSAACGFNPRTTHATAPQVIVILWMCFGVSNWPNRKGWDSNIPWHFVFQSGGLGSGLGPVVHCSWLANRRQWEHAPFGRCCSLSSSITRGHLRFTKRCMARIMLTRQEHFTILRLLKRIWVTTLVSCQKKNSRFGPSYSVEILKTLLEPLRYWPDLARRRKLRSIIGTVQKGTCYPRKRLRNRLAHYCRRVQQHWCRLLSAAWFR